MSKYIVDESSLTAIGDAIREKTGGTELIPFTNMPNEIASITTGGGSGIEVEPIVLSGESSYSCSGQLASKFIELFGDRITTNNLANVNYMFSDYELTNIPFELNMRNSNYYPCNSLFEGAKNLEILPRMNNFYPSGMNKMFYNCYRLRDIPEDVFNNWNYSRLNGYNWSDVGFMFYYCASLRNISESFLKNIYVASNMASYNLPYYGFYYCYCLDEIRGINLDPNTEITSNAFNYSFDKCSRVKDIIFDCNEDGSPKINRIKNQSINLANYVGYAYSTTNILNYNSGITADKQVTDDATYQALKNDVDWWTTDIAYSRYNHDSAVRTINSLPDTSAYLASSGGTNTIKFKGASGSATDGGAINTLTEEEIAVAIAKGWTVTLS